MISAIQHSFFCMKLLSGSVMHGWLGVQEYVQAANHLQQDEKDDD
jgi:hypothetical protein